MAKEKPSKFDSSREYDALEKLLRSRKGLFTGDSSRDLRKATPGLANMEAAAIFMAGRSDAIRNLTNKEATKLLQSVSKQENAVQASLQKAYETGGTQLQTTVEGYSKELQQLYWSSTQNKDAIFSGEDRPIEKQYLPQLKVLVTAIKTDALLNLRNGEFRKPLLAYAEKIKQELTKRTQLQDKLTRSVKGLFKSDAVLSAMSDSASPLFRVLGKIGQRQKDKVGIGNRYTRAAELQQKRLSLVRGSAEQKMSMRDAAEDAGVGRSNLEPQETYRRRRGGAEEIASPTLTAPETPSAVPDISLPGASASRADRRKAMDSIWEKTKGMTIPATIGGGGGAAAGGAGFDGSQLVKILERHTILLGKIYGVTGKMLKLQEDQAAKQQESAEEKDLQAQTSAAPEGAASTVKATVSKDGEKSTEQESGGGLLDSFKSVRNIVNRARQVKNLYNKFKTVRNVARAARAARNVAQGAEVVEAGGLGVGAASALAFAGGATIGAGYFAGMFKAIGGNALGVSSVFKKAKEYGLTPGVGVVETSAKIRNYERSKGIKLSKQAMVVALDKNKKPVFADNENDPRLGGPDTEKKQTTPQTAGQGNGETPTTAAPTTTPTPSGTSAPTTTTPAAAPAAGATPPPTPPPAPTGVGVNAPTASKAPNMSSLDDVKQMIVRHEGIRYRPYKDSLGLWTVGVGHLIGNGKTLPPEMNREFSHNEVMSMFDEDYTQHEKAAMQIPGYNKLNKTGQAALVDLTFNMGPKWIKNFPKTAKALASGDVEGVASGLENSLWYRQVGSRAPEIVSMIRAGGAGSEATPSAAPAPAGGDSSTAPVGETGSAATAPNAGGGAPAAPSAASVGDTTAQGRASVTPNISNPFASSPVGGGSGPIVIAPGGNTTIAGGGGGGGAQTPIPAPIDREPTIRRILDGALS